MSITKEEWMELFQEREGIMRFDGGAKYPLSIRSAMADTEKVFGVCPLTNATQCPS